MPINTPTSNPSTSFWDQMDWHPSSEQLEQFYKFQSLLKHWNQQVNLTRLLDGNDYWVSQVFDSLWPFKYELKEQRKGLRCVDVGSGCGFPGLAVAIALPNAKVTLVEAISRKSTILKTISKELDLTSRITICNARAEKLAHDPLLRGSFDIAMARAVANTPVVAEYLVPLLKQKGEALLYRGKWNKTNKMELDKTLIYLNATIKKIERIELPDNRGERHLISISPIGICSKKYPRAIGIPIKRPLGN